MIPVAFKDITKDGKLIVGDVFLETTEYERDWLMGDFVHREIYLSDARRVVPEKRKTLLRYKLKEKN